MNWNAAVLPTDVERSNLADEVLRATPGPSPLEIITHYVKLVLIPPKKDWERFAESINEDVFRKLKEADAGWRDLPSEEDDGP